MDRRGPQSEQRATARGTPAVVGSRRRRVVLVTMAALVLLMPVSYRAGAEAAHPHAVFQVVIDAGHGGHHHHADEAAHPRAAPDPAATLARWVGGNLNAGETAATGAHAGEPDVPTVSPLKTPLSPVLPPLALAGVALTLVASAACRQPWAGVRRLTGRPSAPESPPPQRALLPAVP